MDGAVYRDPFHPRPIVVLRVVALHLLAIHPSQHPHCFPCLTRRLLYRANQPLLPAILLARPIWLLQLRELEMLRQHVAGFLPREESRRGYSRHPAQQMTLTAARAVTGKYLPSPV
jgi:hypothetical protein